MSYVDTETKMKIEYDNIMSDIKNIEDIDTFYIADDFTYYMSSFNFSKFSIEFKNSSYSHPLFDVSFW